MQHSRFLPYCNTCHTLTLADQKICSSTLPSVIPPYTCNILPPTTLFQCLQWPLSQTKISLAICMPQQYLQINVPLYFKCYPNLLLVHLLIHLFASYYLFIYILCLFIFSVFIYLFMHIYVFLCLFMHTFINCLSLII
jgi:hypothetical protein